MLEYRTSGMGSELPDAVANRGATVTKVRVKVNHDCGESVQGNAHLVKGLIV